MRNQIDLNTGTNQLTESPSRPGFSFYLLVVCLILEYVRPQSIIPGLGSLRLPLILNALLALTIVSSGRFSLTDKQTKLFILFLALMIPHVPLATNNFMALWTLYDMLITFVQYVAIITVVRSVSTFNRLITVWLGIHVVLALYGLSSGGTGPGGFLEDENDFALTINQAIPFAFFLIPTSTTRVKKFVLFGVAGLCAMLTVISFSRGGFLALATLGIYTWLVSPHKIKSASLLALLAVLVFSFAPEEYGNRISSIWEEGASGGTGEERVYQWGIAWEIFVDNPLIGVGQGNLPYRFGEYEDGRTVFERSRAGRAAHSLYFTLLPELGIVGGAIFFFLTLATAKDLLFLRGLTNRRAGDSQGQFVADRRVLALTYAIGGSLLAYLIGAVFISTLYYPNYWLLTAFALALKRSYMHEIDLETSVDTADVTPVDISDTRRAT
jgi:hypothetical protein